MKDLAQKCFKHCLKQRKIRTQFLEINEGCILKGIIKNMNKFKIKKIQLELRYLSSTSHVGLTLTISQW